MISYLLTICVKFDILCILSFIVYKINIDNGHFFFLRIRVKKIRFKQTNKQIKKRKQNKRKQTKKQQQQQQQKRCENVRFRFQSQISPSICFHTSGNEITNIFKGHLGP